MRRRMALVMTLSVLALSGAWTAPASGSVSRPAGTSPPPDECPPYVSTKLPDEVLPYTSFTNAQGAPITISMDVYLPRPLDASTPHPALVFVHGGSWIKGCRTNMQNPAWAAAGRGYIAVSIDYRLACVGDEQGWSQQVIELCGWPFDGLPGGPAVLDVASAFHFLATGGLGPDIAYSGAFGVVGGGAGPTLALSAAATAPDRPAVAVGWSTMTEFGRVFGSSPESPIYLCDQWAYPRVAARCWAGHIRYIGCDPRVDGPHPNPCDLLYDEASPVWSYSASSPPAYFSNGDSEGVLLQNATDLASRLRDLGSTEGTTYQQCTVHTPHHEHGQFTLPLTCFETGASNAQSTASFIRAWLP